MLEHLNVEQFQRKLEGLYAYQFGDHERGIKDDALKEDMKSYLLTDVGKEAICRIIEGFIDSPEHGLIDIIDFISWLETDMELSTW